jgi:5-methylthioribose kinase
VDQATQNDSGLKIYKSPPTKEKRSNQIMTYDLTTLEDTLSYLASTPFDSSTVTPLSGGTANFVWRLVLKTPHEDVHHTAILKHAEGFASAYRALPLSIERFAFEHQALTYIPKNAPFMTSSSVVRLPKVFFCDGAHHVLILEDVGDLPSLKEFVSGEPAPTPGLSSRIGEELGRFLSNLHVWGKENDQVKALFSHNHGAREVCSWRTAGRLVAAAKKFGVDDERIAKIAEKMEQDGLKSEETLTMGDYW